MTEQQKVLGVAVVGLGDRAKNVLRLFFDNHCNGLCELVDHAQAQVTLIDLDTYGGMDLKIRHDDLYPGRPTILMSVNVIEPDGDALFVRKPLVAKQLMAALNEVKVRLAAQQADEALHSGRKKARRHAEHQQEQRRRQGRPASSPASGGVPATEPASTATAAPSGDQGRTAQASRGTVAKPGTQTGPGPDASAVAERRPERGLSEPPPFGRSASAAKPRPAAGDTAATPKSAAEASTKASAPVSTPASIPASASTPASTPASGGGVAAAAGQIDDNAAALFVGSAPDIDPDDPEAVAGAKYCGKLYLQGYLIKACHDAEASRVAMTVTGLWRTILVDPVTRTISYELSLSQLRSLCIIPVKEGEVFIEKLNAGRERPDAIDPEKWHQEPQDAFLWRIALWTSRGRVPETCDLRSQVFLKRWPDMTRLQASPHALRIAALWVKQPYGLLQTAALLGIPQRFVFAFYSAAWAIGLADQGRRQADQLVETDPPPPSPRKGLLGRILSRLRGRH